MTRSLFLFTLLATPVLAADPAVSFFAGGRAVLSLTAADLRARQDARTVEITDPYYGRRKRYRAVPIKNLLTTAYGPAWHEDGVSEVFFEALDGYRSHAPGPTLAEDGGMLAFEDADAAGWEEMPKEKTKPGPFYLVWTGAEQGPEKGYPWPWQILSVKSAIVEEEYPKAVPRNVPSGSRATAGWALFRARCISCHAISGQGGSVGPDLNEPRGVTRYHDTTELKAYIRMASSFRHTKMPDFAELTPRDLDDLIAYLDFMSVQAGTK
jgi:mono/diheme cytochrome c family protein